MGTPAQFLGKLRREPRSLVPSSAPDPRAPWINPETAEPEYRIVDSAALILINPGMAATKKPRQSGAGRHETRPPTEAYFL
jgi:hypothetical protein